MQNFYVDLILECTLLYFNLSLSYPQTTLIYIILNNHYFSHSMLIETYL